MPNTVFKFKQFTIAHDQCAAKVGTDGVLIGALANHPSPNNILDIGTGSGLIALMLAQRFPSSHIIGIETEPAAAKQASANFLNSPFTSLELINDSLQDYTPSKSIELITSNPPYHTENTFAPDDKRFIARHISALPPQYLFNFAARHLAKTGVLWCIYPYSQAPNLFDKATDAGLFLHQQITIQGLENSPIKRVVLCFGKENTGFPQAKNIVIEKERHQYTQAFTNLVKDFYLKL